ncbi:hypothetical protein D3C78_1816750 [compost metagenome]
MWCPGRLPVDLILSLSKDEVVAPKAPLARDLAMRGAETSWFEAREELAPHHEVSGGTIPPTHRPWP